MSLRHDTAPDASSWRQIALVAVLVVLAHALLLAALPRWSGGDTPLPLAQRFETRTIVLAPPAPPAPAAAPAAPAAEAVAPKVQPRPRAAEARPAPPRRVVRPKPQEDTPSPAAVLAAQEAAAQMSRIELTPPPAAAGAGEPAPVNEVGEPGGTAASPGGEGPGQGQGEAAATGLAAPAGGQPMQVHASVRLTFEMTGQRGVQPWKGVFGELLWLQDGDEYNARLSLKMLFKTIRSQTSVGRVDAGGIAPARFSETRRTEVASQLLREEGKVVFGNNAPSVPLLPGAQDRLSVVMQLGALLSSDPARYPEGSRISMQTVGPREAGVWTFIVEGTERIAVPAGEYEVRRLSRAPRDAHDYKLELWLAPELGWLPARMRQTEQDGDVIDLSLRSTEAP